MEKQACCTCKHFPSFLLVFLKGLLVRCLMPKVLLEVSIITEEPRLALTCNVEQHPVSLFGITNTHSSGGAATASITNHQVSPALPAQHAAQQQ